MLTTELNQEDETKNEDDKLGGGKKGKGGIQNGR